MEKAELINMVARLINQASAHNRDGNLQQVTECLVKIRELLNDPANLEAGSSS